jgi:hypothetical protein
MGTVTFLKVLREHVEALSYVVALPTITMMAV